MVWRRTTASAQARMPALIFAGLLIVGTRPATGEATLYSKTFEGDGSGKFVSPTCKVVPHDCNVGLNGTEALPILVNPWEPVSIGIRCLELVFLPAQTIAPGARLFVGNSHSPDIMLWLTPGAIGGRSSICYPRGTSFPFPAAVFGAPPNKRGQNDFGLPHLDVHILGTPARFWYWPFASGKYVVYLTVYYTKNPI